MSSIWLEKVINYLIIKKNINYIKKGISERD